MKLEMLRKGINLIPEKPQEIAYLEDTLLLKEDGDILILRRQDVNKYAKNASVLPFHLTTDYCNKNEDQMENKSRYEIELPNNATPSQLEELKKFMSQRIPNAKLKTVQPSLPALDESVMEFGLLED